MCFPFSNICTLFYLLFLPSPRYFFSCISVLFYYWLLLLDSVIPDVKGYLFFGLLTTHFALFAVDSFGIELCCITDGL